MFSLMYLNVDDTYRNIYRYVYIHGLVYTDIFPCSVSYEALEAMTPQ